MAVTITPINVATDTFNTWVTQTNTIIDALANEVMTANNDANGAFVTGNSQLFGIYTANVIAAHDELRGGNVQVAASLLISSNVTANTGQVNVGVNDSVPGILRLFGGGTGEVSAGIYLYNNADDDTNADYWLIEGEDGTGDFVIGDPGTTDALRIDETTFLLTIANGLTITTGVLTLNANIDIGLNDRLILDDDDDTSIYAPSDDQINFEVGGATEYSFTATVADFETNNIRTGGDIVVDTSSGFLRLGETAANVTANSTVLRLQNSTVTFDLSKPTAAQVSDGAYFLNADGSWSTPVLGTVTTITSGTSAQEVDSFAKATYRSAEYFMTIEDNGANNHQVAKILVLHEDSTTNALITEYAKIISNTDLGTFSANSNTTHCIVYFTPTVAATTVKAKPEYTNVA